MESGTYRINVEPGITITASPTTVTCFHVRRDFLGSYETHQVGGRTIVEYRIPAEDLAGLARTGRRIRASRTR